MRMPAQLVRRFHPLVVQSRATFRGLGSSPPVASPPNGARRRRAQAPPLALRGIPLHEGGGCVTAAARELPRAASRRLRRAGDLAGARAVLDAARAASSPNVADLVELLLVMLAAGRGGPNARGPRETVQEMLDVVASSPASRNRTLCNVLLTACAREAARTGDNAAVKQEFLLRAARNIWRDMASESSSANRAMRPDRVTVALMYRVCGECHALEDARKVHARAVRMNLQAHADSIASYILCLGKCGRSTEAEDLYYSDACAPFRAEPYVLGALFQAHVASDRISKAEALIAQHGAQFLNVQSCNAFVNRCTTLHLRDKALEFVKRMRNSQVFPNPDARTYNLLIKTLCAKSSRADAKVSSDRALEVVSDMVNMGIDPTTVTYNTLIRSLAEQGRLEEAMSVYMSMSAPDHLTFSHLMMGAAKAEDIDLARRLKRDLDSIPGVYPNYNFCKTYLMTLAMSDGIEASFDEAKVMAVQYGDALSMFGDVGGREAVRMALIHACGVVRDLPRAFAALRLDLEGSDDDVGLLAPLYIGTALMQVCLDCGARGQAMEVFHSIKRAGLTPNFEVYEKLVYGLTSGRMSSCAPGGDAMSKLDTHDEERAQSVVESSDDSETGRLESGDENGVSVSVSAIDGAVGSSKDDDLDKLELESDSELMYGVHECLDESPMSVSWKVPRSFMTALTLMREMHMVGAARVSRHACYVYNSFIAAAARCGDLDMSFQLFLKMCLHNNPNVIYVARSRSADDASVDLALSPVVVQGRPVNVGLCDISFKFPSAVPGTYNSMIQAARVSGRADLSFGVYETMEADRINEPCQATFSLLTEICLEDSRAVGFDQIQRLLKRLDGLMHISPDLRLKRASLRKLVLSLRWNERRV